MRYVRFFWMAVMVILSCSILFQWTRRPLNCYHDKHVETAESSALLRQPTADEPNSNHIPNNKKYCQWTITAGDSNNRIAFEEWLRLEQNFGDGRIVTEAKRTPLLYEYSWDGHHCTAERWADREMVITYPTIENSPPTTPPCHIISLRFMIDQRQSLARLRANLTNSSYCGSELETLPLPAGYKRPSKPDMMWYTSGFWDLRSEQRTSCEQRFSHVVDAMVEWKNDPNIKHVVWQTGFPIIYHSEFNNTMIFWDYHCQKKLASQYGIEIADIFELVRSSGGPAKNVNSRDCHLHRDKHLIPHQYLDRCCGGWERYLNGNGNK